MTMKLLFKYATRTILFFVLLNFSFAANAQKSKTIKFHTSAQCGMCKSTIENALSYEPGIQFAELSMEDMFLTVKFKTKKTDEDAVKKMVSDIGYSAGEVKANEKAMNELPKCCQPGVHL
jgi:copper chaperone CopZ